MRSFGRLLLFAVPIGLLAVTASATEALWMSLFSQARVLYQQQQQTQVEGVRVARSALKVARETFERSDPRLAESLELLGMLYISKGEPGRAEALYQQALGIREKAHGLKHPAVANALILLRYANHYQGRAKRAELFHKRALAIRRYVYGPGHPIVTETLSVPANPEGFLRRKTSTAWTGPKRPSQRGKTAGSKKTVSQRVRSRQTSTRTSLGERVFAMAEALGNRAEIYANLGRHTEAEALFQQSIAIYDKNAEPNHPGRVEVLEKYSGFLKKTGRLPESNVLQRKIRTLQSN